MRVVNLTRPFEGRIIGPSGIGPRPFYWVYRNDLGHESNWGHTATREEAEAAVAREAQRIRTDKAMGFERLEVHR